MITVHSTKYIGMTTIEHALPVPQLYEDVLTFYALSGTGSTPTHIVNYGGTWGEQLVWAHQNVPNDPKHVMPFAALNALMLGPTGSVTLRAMIFSKASPRALSVLSTVGNNLIARPFIYLMRCSQRTSSSTLPLRSLAWYRRA
jgi:hypothetical protein